MKTESLCTPASEKSHRVRDQGTHAALTKKWQTLPPSSYMQATKGRGSTVPRGLWSLVSGKAQCLGTAIPFCPHQGGEKGASLCRGPT